MVQKQTTLMRVTTGGPRNMLSAYKRNAGYMLGEMEVSKVMVDSQSPKGTPTQETSKWSMTHDWMIRSPMTKRKNGTIGAIENTVLGELRSYTAAWLLSMMTI